MLTLSHLSDRELLAGLPEARAAERTAVAQMIAYLAEVDRRRLYLAEACSSLFSFCVERLGYSENEAQKRIQVARLYQRLPQVLAELENGSIHLTGLFLLAAHLTDANAGSLLGETLQLAQRGAGARGARGGTHGAEASRSGGAREDVGGARAARVRATGRKERTGESAPARYEA